MLKHSHADYLNLHKMQRQTLYHNFPRLFLVFYCVVLILVNISILLGISLKRKVQQVVFVDRTSGDLTVHTEIFYTKKNACMDNFHSKAEQAIKRYSVTSNCQRNWLIVRSRSNVAQKTRAVLSNVSSARMPAHCTVSCDRHITKLYSRY